MVGKRHRACMFFCIRSPAAGSGVPSCASAKADMASQRGATSVASRVLPRAVEIEARAKLNLGLAVGPERADGYHEIATIYQSITLADTLVATRIRRGFRLRVRHEDASVRGQAGRALRAPVPAGESNLVVRAARKMAERAGSEGGASFRLIERTPARAGLGGGSADAAA